jgi:hypothetical protein
MSAIGDPHWKQAIFHCGLSLSARQQAIGREVLRAYLSLFHLSRLAHLPLSWRHGSQLQANPRLTQACVEPILHTSLANCAGDSSLGGQIRNEYLLAISWKQPWNRKRTDRQSWCCPPLQATAVKGQLIFGPCRPPAVGRQYGHCHYNWWSSALDWVVHEASTSLPIRVGPGE